VSVRVTGVARTGQARAIRMHARSIIAATAATVIGFACFVWPFVLGPGRFGARYTPPIMFGLTLVLVLAVLFAEIADGGIDSKAIAMLGVLSAINAGLRPLGAGTAGFETVFFLLVFAGRVFGPGFGFALGCTSLFASAVITGGVGPWMPYQMFASAWIGLFAGLLPRCRGKREIALLALYGVLAGYFYGFMLNLQFWPFSVDPGSSISYLPGAPFTVQWHRYLVFDATTSLGWDTGRAITDFICIVLLGPGVLHVLRRASRRARFETPVVFTAPGAAMAADHRSPTA
jgi:energy-coupling factor transport system substrate-specific component